MGSRYKKQKGKGGRFKGQKRQRGKKQKGGLTDFRRRLLPGPIGTFPNRRNYKEYVYIR